MINLIKTQKNTDGKYLEEMKTFKWINLTPIIIIIIIIIKLNKGRLDVAPLTATVERREVTSQTTCRDELKNKVHKSVKLKGVKLMTQRAEGNF